MGKYPRLLLITCIWLLLFCLPVSASGANKVTLQLKWFHQFQPIQMSFRYEPSRFTKIAETYVALGLTDKISVDQDFLYASNKSLLDLTPEEQIWIKQHPVIRVHNEKDWPPFNYFEYGTPRGLSIDYMNLVAEKLGIEVEYVSGPSWNEFLEMVKRKELDVMLNIVKTEDRQKYLLYTDPYVKNPNVIVSSQNSPYENDRSAFRQDCGLSQRIFL